MNPLLIVGDSLLDRDLDGHAQRLAPDAPVPVVDLPRESTRPGGAALAATLAARDGRAVVFVTALGDDDSGRTVATLLERAGVEVVDLTTAGATGQKVRVRAAGHPLLRLDYGGNDDAVAAPAADVVARITSARTILVSDYGRGVAAQPQVRAAIRAAADAGARVVWDPHPRGPRPVAGTRVVTPNLLEAQRVAGTGDDDTLPAVTATATALQETWATAGVAITLGARGALLVSGDGTPLMVPAPHVRGTPDPCGAGDRFAVSVAGAIADGAVLSEAVVRGVHAATAFVAGGGIAMLTDALGAGDRTATAGGDGDNGHAGDDDGHAGHGNGHVRDGDPAPDDHRAAADLIAEVHARGGTVVATGGCFDLLHAGHVRLLTDAAALGNCLVVCVNSDTSVRRLKGPGRPVVGERDRRAVLLALAAVDAVVLFDEDTPEAVLSQLRPDVWVKGADYAVADLPEARLLAKWGGRAVVLPYLDGRSTTAMIKEAARHARN
jgi:rfaE bifunctional protein nucleotidyltransferase chain/domain/rfaE bifunctional protein kinase chain/domain